MAVTREGQRIRCNHLALSVAQVSGHYDILRQAGIRQRDAERQTSGIEGQEQPRGRARQQRYRRLLRKILIAKDSRSADRLRTDDLGPASAQSAGGPARLNGSRTARWNGV